MHKRSSDLFAKKLGRRVATQRRMANLTQAALAEKVSVTVETISRLERGSATPSIERLNEIAVALEMSLAELLQTGHKQTEKEQAIQRLLVVFRRRGAEDISVITDVAELLFQRWK